MATTPIQTALTSFMRGNEAAVQLLMALAQVMHLWDDLIDRDKVPDDAQINTAMWHAVVTVPENPFYRRHFDQLQPVIVAAVMSWHAATHLEREAEGRPETAEKRLRIAHIVRADYANVIITAARLVGGPAWAIECAPAVREWIVEEDFDTYLAGLEIERRGREPYLEG